MRSRLLLNLALLAAVVALALLVYFEPGLEKPAEPVKLTSLEPEKISTVRIERSSQGEIRVQRDTDGWRLMEPISAHADKYRMEGLLRITSAESHTRYPVAELNLAEVGLQTPNAVLFLDETELRFGGTEPINGRRYVQVGDTVHLINDFAYYHLIGDYPTFVSPRLLPEGARVDALHLPNLTLTWRDGRWDVSPEPVKFSADQANVLIDAWRFASAMGVESYDPGEGGEPVRIELEGESIEFLITRREPELEFARPDLRVKYRFPGEQADALLALPNPSGEPETTPEQTLP
jgi:hypothetical protein